MDAMREQTLLTTLKSLSPDQLAAVEDFVDFLINKARKHAALERLLAIAPALEAAGAEPMSEAEIDAEVQAARKARRSRDMGQNRWHEATSR